jgi:hypothetical protein
MEWKDKGWRDGFTWKKDDGFTWINVWIGFGLNSSRCALEIIDGNNKQSIDTTHYQEI